MGLHTAGGSVATWAWTKQKRLSEATCAAAATRDSRVAAVWVFLCGADRWTSRERLQRADVRWKTSYKDVVKRTLSPWQAHQNQRTVWGALLWCNLKKWKTFPVEEKHLINNRTLGANGKGIRRKAHLEPTREEPRHLRTMCFPYLGSYFLICIHSFFLT